MKFSLAKLNPGASAKVLDILGHGPVERRLLEMGLVSGAKVSAVRKSPLGNSIEFKIFGSNIVMRRNEAERVLVEPLSA